jgi:hypothetical protein
MNFSRSFGSNRNGPPLLRRMHGNSLPFTKRLTVILETARSLDTSEMLSRGVTVLRLPFLSFSHSGSMSEWPCCKSLPARTPGKLRALSPSYLHPPLAELFTVLFPLRTWTDRPARQESTNARATSRWRLPGLRHRKCSPLNLFLSEQENFGVSP